jgi:hypothetical protein
MIKIVKKYNEITLFQFQILNIYCLKYTKYLISQNEIEAVGK